MPRPRESHELGEAGGAIVDAASGGPFLEAIGSSRFFGPVEALSDITVAFRARKSTRVKILSGRLSPTRGARAAT